MQCRNCVDLSLCTERHLLESCHQRSIRRPSRNSLLCWETIHQDERTSGHRSLLHVWGCSFHLSVDYLCFCTNWSPLRGASCIDALTLECIIKKKNHTLHHNHDVQSKSGSFFFFLNMQLRARLETAYGFSSGFPIRPAAGYNSQQSGLLNHCIGVCLETEDFKYVI